jgi:hypothetical protein
MPNICENMTTEKVFSLSESFQELPLEMLVSIIDRIELLVEDLNL